MTSRGSSLPAYIGLAFVAHSAAIAHKVIWRFGGNVRHMLSDLHVSLPLPLRLAIYSHVELTVLAVSALVLAVAAHRHERAPLYLGLLGGFVLVIAAEYLFALWLFLRQLPDCRL